MEIKTTFWDWNGTLWDDVHPWFLAAQAAYRHAGVDNLTLERLQDAFDVPIKEVVHTLGAPRNLPQSAHDALLKTFAETLAKNTHLAQARDGAADVVRAFRDIGIANFIASNHPVDLLRQEVERASLAEYFGTICGNDHYDVVYIKGTKEQRIRGHLIQHGINPSEAVIIADTREEIRIARAIGMRSIAITGGYNSRHVLEGVGPDHIVDHLDEIPRVLRFNR